MFLGTSNDAKVFVLVACASSKKGSTEFELRLQRNPAKNDFGGDSLSKKIETDISGILW